MPDNLTWTRSAGVHTADRGGFTILVTPGRRYRLYREGKPVSVAYPSVGMAKEWAEELLASPDGEEIVLTNPPEGENRPDPTTAPTATTCAPNASPSPAAAATPSSGTTSPENGTSTTPNPTSASAPTAAARTDVPPAAQAKPIPVPAVLLIGNRRPVKADGTTLKRWL